MITTQREEFTTEMRGELIRRLHRLRRLLEKDGKEEKIRGNLPPFSLINLRNLRNLRIIDGLNLWFNSVPE